MSIDNEKATAQRPVEAIMQSWFTERELEEFEKGQVLFFEFAGYDSRYDEDSSAWNNACELLGDMLGTLGFSWPIEVSCSIMETPTILEGPADIGGQLLDLCCLMLPIEDDEDGESRISLRRKEDDVTIEVELIGSFQTAEVYNALGEYSDSKVEIKVDPIFNFTTNKL